MVLKQLENYINNIINSVAVILGIEVTVINQDYKRIAGTGRYHNTLQSKINKKTISGYIFQEKSQYIVDDPAYNNVCNNCNNRIVCPIKAIISSPIIVEDKVLGVLNLIALTEKQKYDLLTQQRNYLKFVERLCELVSSKVSEINIKNQLSIMADNFETIIESLQEGIIVLDKFGSIEKANRSSLQMLAIAEEDELREKSITGIFDSIKMDDLLDNYMFKRERSIEQDFYYRKGNHNKHFVGTITPIIKDEEFKGGIISFKNFKDIQQYASHFISEGHQIDFADIIGESDKIKGVKTKAEVVSPNDSTILIRGESGTGKEIFARAIHAGSLRKEGPFIAVNCAAIPDNLLESELFGYTRGAFTGAQGRGKPGKFELANGGTLFLDEIGDMSLHLQAKLLRVIEEKYIERLGGTRPIKVDVRIIAATNKNLEKMLGEGQFRDDLYYRLNVIPIEIPGLRERREDIPLIIEEFIKKYNLYFGKKIEGLSRESAEYIMQYDWPGNVRELENAIEYAMNLEKNNVITPANLPDTIKKYDQINLQQQNGGLPTLNLKNLEELAIKKAVKKYGDDTEGKKKAAGELGIGIATLYRRIGKLSK